MFDGHASHAMKPIKYEFKIHQISKVLSVSFRPNPCFPNVHPISISILYQSYINPISIPEGPTYINPMAAQAISAYLQAARSSRRCAEMRRRTGSSLLVEPWRHRNTMKNP